MQVSDLYDPRNPWASYLINAINAKEIQKKDVSYIVRGDQVSRLTAPSRESLKVLGQQ